MGKNNIEERLINFAVSVLGITEKMNKSYIANHLKEQLIRSSSSAALNYGEAQSAESKKDFVHKMKVVLKELRESHVSLRIIQKSKLITNDNFIQPAIDENDELISIFVVSVNTALKNLDKEKNKPVS